MFPRLSVGSTFVLLAVSASVDGAAGAIPAELIVGVTGHPNYMTHSYSLPIVVRERDVFLAYLEDDPRTSSSVIRRDHRTAKWSHPVRLGGGRLYDAHYYPNIVADNRGFLHVFYGCHGDGLRYRRSSRASDVSQWEKESIPLSVATYPRPFVLASGAIVVFMRTQGTTGIRYGYVVSRDGGMTWSRFKTVIHSPGRLWSPYVGGVSIVEKQTTPVVHIAWSWYDMRKKSYPYSYDDPVYASFEFDSDQTGGGTTGPLPITHETVAPILRRERAYVNDSTVGSLGRPHVLISQYGVAAKQKEPSKTLLAVLEKDAWQFVEPLPGVVFPVGGCRMIAAAGWTAIVGLTSTHGLVIVQRRDGEKDFIVRPIQRIPGFTPVHPVIVTDNEQSQFHIAATGYRDGQPGALIYATANIEP